eukprot:1350686-Amphidinium_carterae.1
MLERLLAQCYDSRPMKTSSMKASAVEVLSVGPWAKGFTLALHMNFEVRLAHKKSVYELKLKRQDTLCVASLTQLGG